MLIAVNKQNQYCLADRAGPEEEYFCPACFKPVLLRRGQIKVSHFAHQQRSGCSFLAEGETTTHLRGKLSLFRYFSTFGQVEIEPVLKEIGQRPDLLLVDQNESRLAIEYQCSPLSVKRLHERNAGYQKLGLRVLWLLGPRYLQRRLSGEMIARYLSANQSLWFFVSDCRQFVVQDQFCKVDFQRLHFRQRTFAQPALTDLLGKETAKQGTFQPGIVSVDRQRTKLTLLMLQGRVPVEVVDYLYQRGHRLDQIPDWCLLGQQFGLIVPNWQFRLIFILLLEKYSNQIINWATLQYRLHRYFYPSYQFW